MAKKIITIQEAVEPVQPIKLPDLTASIDAVTAEYLRCLPHRLRTMYDNSIAQILGFKHDTHRGWEVDHCNGRTSAISKLVSAKSQKIIAQIVEEYEIDSVRIEGYVAEALKRADYELQREVDSKVRRILNAKMEAMIEEKIETLIAKVTKVMHDTVGQYIDDLTVNLSDPNALNSSMKCLIAEEVVEAGLNGEESPCDSHVVL